MSTFRRLCALLLASAVLIGIPYLLLWHLPWPQPDVSPQTLLVHLRSLSLPPGAITALLITALWGVWGLYAAALAAEAVARARGGGLRIRPLGPLQILAATAIGASIATPTSAFADTVQVQQTHPEPQQDDDTGRPGGSGEDDEQQSGESPSGGAPQTPRAEPGTSVERSRTVAGFTLESAQLTEPMRQDLADVADLVGDFGATGTSIRITGHTDPSGPDTVNLGLSKQRAESAADYLRDRLGDDAPRIETEGVGSADSRDGDPQAQRRIEITYQVASGDNRPAPETPQAGPDKPDQAPDQQDNHDDTAGTGHQAAGQSGSGGDGPEHEAAAAAAGVGKSSQGDGGADDAGDTADASTDQASVVVLEVPDAATTGALAVAGIVGGYAIGRSARVPGIRLSLPRLLRTRGSEPRALPPVPGRPEPEPDIDHRITVELDHVPGLGLTGPGARAAARRLVVNALGDTSQRPARVLMTGTYAVQLLGPEAYGVLESHPCEPVRLAETTEDALAQLQRELHERATGEPASAEGRPLVLITDNDQHHETALSGLLLHGQRRGITAVVTGRWPLGGSCHIAEDGLITETSPPLHTLHHASWPGSGQSEVVAAIRAYRHSRPSDRTAVRPAPSAAAEALGNPWAAPAESTPAHAAAAGLSTAQTAPAATGAAGRGADGTATGAAAAASAAAPVRAQPAEAADESAPTGRPKAGKQRPTRAGTAANRRTEHSGTERLTDLSGFTEARTPATRPGDDPSGDRRAPADRGGEQTWKPSEKNTEAAEAATAEQPEPAATAPAETGPDPARAPVPPVGPVSELPRRNRPASGPASKGDGDFAESPVQAGDGAKAPAAEAEAEAEKEAPARPEPAKDGSAEPAASAAASWQVPAGPVSQLPRRRPGSGTPAGTDAGVTAEETPSTRPRPATSDTAADPDQTRPADTAPAAGAALNPHSGRSGGRKQPPGAAERDRAPRAEERPQKGQAPQPPVLGRKPAPPPATAPEAQPTTGQAPDDAVPAAETATGAAAPEAPADSAPRPKAATARAARVRRMRQAKARDSGRTDAADRSGSDPDSAIPPAEAPNADAPASRSGATSGGSATRTAPPQYDAADEPAPTQPPDRKQPDRDAEHTTGSGEDGGNDSGGDQPDQRPLPRKPRKAGRGRNWRPRETT